MSKIRGLKLGRINWIVHWTITVYYLVNEDFWLFDVLVATLNLGIPLSELRIPWNRFQNGTRFTLRNRNTMQTSSCCYFVTLSCSKCLCAPRLSLLANLLLWKGCCAHAALCLLRFLWQFAPEDVKRKKHLTKGYWWHGAVIWLQCKLAFLCSIAKWWKSSQEQLTY